MKIKNRIMAKKIIFLHWVLITLMFVDTNVYAQKRTTVLLNQETNPTKYKFDPNILPSDMVIQAGDVKLQLNIETNKLDDKQIRQVYIKRNGTNIGTSRIDQKSQGLILNLNLNQPIEKKEAINFEQTYDKTDNNPILCPSDVKNATFNLNKQPRLAIDYEVSKEPYRQDWAQTAANAQHTNSIDWKLENSITIDNIKIEKNLVGTLSEYMCLYQNRPVVFENRGSQKNYITFLTGSDLRELRSIEANGSPIRQPIIDHTGKMFYFSNQNTIEIIDLASGTLITSKALNTIQGGQNLNINSITNEATIGFDGTLYLPIANNNGSAGTVALTAYPSLQPRWFYNTTNPVGPVSLSQNEQLACFIESDLNTQKSKLVVLDNVTGSIKYESDPVLGSYLNDKNYYIPPVVIETPNKETTNVYVLNGNKSSNKLYLFSINRASTAQTPTKLLEKLIANSNQIQNTGICQPTVNSSGVYYIKNGTLTNYDFKEDKETPLIKYAKRNSTTNKDDFYIIQGFFSDDVQIASNASDMLFVQTIIGVSVFSVSPTKFMKMILDPGLKQKPSNDNAIKSLYVAPNAVAFGISKTNNSLVIGFVPKSQDEKHHVVLSKIDHRTLYIGKNISINTNVVESYTNAIFLGQKISINKGFKIKKGASLTFQVIK
jgi:hypothetical protein